MFKSPFIGVLLCLGALVILPQCLVQAGEYTYAPPASCANVKLTEDDEPAPCTAGEHDDEDDDEPGLKQSDSNKDRRWENGTIPFVITGTFTPCQLDLIAEGMRMVSVQTDNCITFVNRTTETYYVNIVNGDGCSTKVGRQSKSKTGLNHVVKLGKVGSNGCFNAHNDEKGLNAATPAHELIHAVGFHHEFQRCDRCKSITVNNSNIQNDSLHNFAISGDQVSGVFDLHSIMNYGDTTGSKDRKGGLKTITTVDKNESYGSANKLTDKDIQKIKTLYQCPGYKDTFTQCSALGYTCEDSPAATTTTTTTKAPKTTKATTTRTSTTRRRGIFPGFPM